MPCTCSVGGVLCLFSLVYFLFVSDEALSLVRYAVISPPFFPEENKCRAPTVGQMHAVSCRLVLYVSSGRAVTVVNVCANLIEPFLKNKLN